MVCTAEAPGFARKYTEVCLVKSFISGIENLIVGTEKGQLRVFNMTPHVHQEMAFDMFNAHLGEVTKILSSPDGRYVFSAGSDGTVFVYSVTEYANEATMVKQEITVASAKDEQTKLEQLPVDARPGQLQLVVDEQLASIVLVRKQVMEQWRKDQEQLRQEMEDEKTNVDSKLSDDKNKYD